MRITSSQIAMTATHVSSLTVVRSERLEAARAAPEATPAAADAAATSLADGAGPSVRGQRHGHHHHHHHDEGGNPDGGGRNRDRGGSDRLTFDLMVDPPKARGWNVTYDSHEERRESERTSFAAAGTVTTADGRRIDFATAFAQQRQEVATRDVHVELHGVARETPSLSAASAPAASPTAVAAVAAAPPAATKSRLVLGGGYLALDDGAAPGGDGQDNAPSAAHWLGASGDGFSDLAALDGDHNGWIDEADPAWGHLRLVQPAENAAPEGGATLTAAGIGAIAVAKVATPFDGSAGRLAASGVYLEESGAVGIVQQVDRVA